MLVFWGVIPVGILHVPLQPSIMKHPPERWSCVLPSRRSMAATLEQISLDVPQTYTSRKLTYPTLGKGKSSLKVLGMGIC